MSQFSERFISCALALRGIPYLLSAILCLCLAACGGGGSTAPASGTSVTLVAAVSINASAATGNVGQTITLTWSAANTGATSCTAADAWSGQLALTGTQSVKLLAAGTSNYSLSCNGVSNAVSVVVNAVPTVSLTFTPPNVVVAQSSALTWSSTDASSCTASGAWSGTQALSGSQQISQTSPGSYNYVLTCIGAGGSVTGSDTLVVTAVPAPTVTLTLTPSNVVVAQSSALTWSSTDASSCTASGTWSGTKALAGSQQISQSTPGTYSYALTCVGVGGSVTGSASLVVTAVVNNTASVIVDNGPAGANGVFNAPFVSVTVCRPGTAICQTIDHVLVDTGSFGLRLIAPLDAALALPTVQTATGAQVGECVQFITGYTWGAVQQADVKVGAETASALSIQVINEGSSAFASVPSDCSNTGGNLGSVAALGAKGILGIGMFKQDCGTSCVSVALPGNYYACNGTSCQPSTLPLTKQVTNPVAAFAGDNNGVLIVFPAVPSGGMASLTGTLIFGIGTQSNNKLVSETVYAASANGNFTTAYKGNTWTASFLDSGSNGFFFTDKSITACAVSTSFYCPVSALNLTAVNSAYDGSKSGTVTFSIENVDKLSNGTHAASVGGTFGSASPTSSRSFDWGLPFFFGRRVFVGFESPTGLNSTSQYWAY